ncbi:MAG: tRNA 2-thiouridine(34) synthase MnmA [Pirellulales bacterium]|nr:tRNA 2-thiouridine(34) synthase MnmA [Pirellulales bacterium]
MARVVLAMSGGVDSSVAAHLLCQEGHEVIGIFMRHGQTLEMACAAPGQGTSSKSPSESWDKTSGLATLPIVSVRSDHKQGCCTASDAADARRVATQLGIPFYALDFTDAFDRIIDYFVEEYSAARTPNPCVMCNNWIKFGRLFDYAASVDAQYVATGHYARLEGADATGSYPRLLRGLDDDKDQSYVLFGVERPLLSKMLLPLGNFRKPHIRALAAELGLRVADKKDSQEICFVSAGKQAEFVRRRRALAGDSLDTSGEIVSVEGRVLGRHDGIEGYTIGQRKGLGVALGEPYYVVRIDADSRQVVLGRREDLARTTLTANGANWLADPPRRAFSAAVQIRYNSSAQPAIVTPTDHDESSGVPRRFEVSFLQPVHGVAPGQAAVIYEGDQVLGGGWIEG